MNNNELHHHGIKGMRWGVRRTPSQLGHRPVATKKKLFGGVTKKKQSTNDKSKEMSVEEKKARVLKSRSAQELFNNAHLFNDKELNDAYMRLNLEKNIKNLIEHGPSKAEKFVGDMVKWGGKISALTKQASDIAGNIGTLSKNLNALLGEDDTPDDASANKPKKDKPKKDPPDDKSKKDKPDDTPDDKSKKDKPDDTPDNKSKKDKPDDTPDNKKSESSRSNDTETYTGETIIFDSPKKNRTSDSDGGTSTKSYETFWTNDYTDLSDTPRSREVVSTYHNTTISGLLGGASLPAVESRVSGYLSSPVAGYLAPPKEDD